MRSALSAARAAALVMASVTICAPASAQPPPSPARRADSLGALEPSCARAARAPARLVADAHWVDAHLVAETVDALCDGSGEPREWQLWNAVALIRLDEGGRAHRPGEVQVRLDLRQRLDGADRHETRPYDLGRTRGALAGPTIRAAVLATLGP